MWTFFQDKSSLNLTPEVPWDSLDHHHFEKTSDWQKLEFANRELTSLVKEATGVYELMISTNQMISYTMSRQFIRVMSK